MPDRESLAVPRYRQSSDGPGRTDDTGSVILGEHRQVAECEVGRFPPNACQSSRRIERFDRRLPIPGSPRLKRLMNAACIFAVLVALRPFRLFASDAVLLVL